MKAIAEIRIEPIGTGASTREHVERAVRELRSSGVEARVGAMSTELYGELDQITAGLNRVHEVLHSEGLQRLTTTLSLRTQADKPVSLDEPVRAVDAAVR